MSYDLVKIGWAKGRTLQQRLPLPEYRLVTVEATWCHDKATSRRRRSRMDRSSERSESWPPRFAPARE
jgi:hypothetical protein